MLPDVGDELHDGYLAARRGGLDERGAFDAAVEALRRCAPRLSHVTARRLLARALSQGRPALA